MKRLAILASMSILAACGGDGERVASGTSSEVPNALSGRVLSESGMPVAGCKVRLASSRSRSDSLGRIDSTVTDSDGRWTLVRTVGTDSVTLLIVRRDSMALAYIASGGTAHPPRLDTLRTASWVRGAVAGADAPTRVYVQGTPFQAVTDSAGNFLLGPVPAADLSILLEGSSGSQITRTELVHRAMRGDTTSLPLWTIDSATWETEDYGTWTASRTATIDFTSSGAAITGDHVGFAVPVRLDGIVDARSVSPGELRFDNGDGVRYPFQIERWDPASGSSVVWVRLDTANGNSAKHDLRVFWGRLGAKIPSDMPPVFDSMNGFRAAWHAGASTAPADAPRLSWSDAVEEDGLVGTGWTVSGKGSFASDSMELGGSNSWTISMWIRLDRKPSGETILAGFSDGPDSTRWGLSVRDDQVVRVWSGADSAKSLEADTPLRIGVWTHLAATFDAVKSRIGLVVDTVSYARQEIVFPKASRQMLRGARGLVGSIDEIRLSRLDREKEWSVLECRTSLSSAAWLRWK